MGLLLVAAAFLPVLCLAATVFGPHYMLDFCSAWFLANPTMGGFCFRESMERLMILITGNRIRDVRFQE